jgi:hypothetical protein
VRSSRPSAVHISAFLTLVFALGCPPGGGADGTETLTSGDPTCEPGTLNCPCREDQSCELGLLCASNICISDPQGTTTPGTTGPSTSTSATGTDATTEDTATDTSESTTTHDTHSADCDPEEGVQDNPSCQAPASFCDPDGACVDCSGIVCAALDPSTPACDLISGACVQCSAEDTSACGTVTPICDPLAQVCVPCAEHSQCSTGACNLASGACFPPKVLWVDKAAAPGGCAEADGSEAKPYCEIQDAAQKIPKNDPTILRVRAAPSAYTSQVSIQEGRFIAIIRDAGVSPRLEVLGSSALTIAKGGFAFVDGFNIAGATQDRGIVCAEGTLWLDRSRLNSREEVGIDGNGCSLHVRRSLIARNSLGGIKQTNGGSVHVENSFIVNNGGFLSDVGGLSMIGANQVSVIYSTIAGNEAKVGLGSSLHCVTLQSASTVNSVLLAKPGASSISCSDMDIEYSLLDSDKYAQSTNTVVQALDPAWFVNPASNDYHVTPTAPFKMVALWLSGQPKVDYDGDLRPTVDSSPDYAGADLRP